MHRLFLLLLSGAFLSLSPAQDTALVTPPTEAIPEAESHAELADELVTLLQRTAAVLEQCTDASAVEAALPQLRQLRTEADSLIARQAALPEPTVQDYMAAQDRANDFLDAKRAIQTHLERLIQEGFMTDELREILGIAPESATSGT